jgi:hypothetical protein
MNQYCLAWRKRTTNEFHESFICLLMKGIDLWKIFDKNLNFLFVFIWKKHRLLRNISFSFSLKRTCAFVRKYLYFSAYGWVLEGDGVEWIDIYNWVGDEVERVWRVPLARLERLKLEISYTVKVKLVLFSWRNDVNVHSFKEKGFYKFKFVEIVLHPHHDI